MPHFLYKPVITPQVEAYRWFKNGDHPDDDCKMFLDEELKPFRDEGKIVRYFRDPFTDPFAICQKCSHAMNDHGFIDIPPNGFSVCPGDWIITKSNGQYIPMSDREFRNTYEELDETIKGPLMDDEINPIQQLMGDVLDALRDEKGTDRSEKARRLAVTITEMEKVYAYYVQFVLWFADDERGIDEDSI